MIQHEEADKLQGVVEYNLVRGLVALVFIVVLVFLAPKLSHIFSSLNNSLMGVSGDNGSQSYIAHSTQSNVFHTTPTALNNWTRRGLSSIAIVKLFFGVFISIGFIGLIWLAYLNYQRKKMLYEID